MQIRLSGIAARRGCGIGLPQLSQGVISAWSIRSCCRSSNRRTLRSPHLLHLSSPNSSETALSVGPLSNASSTNEPSNSAVCPHWLQTTESLENTCILQSRAERRRNNTGHWWRIDRISVADDPLTCFVPPMQDHGNSVRCETGSCSKGRASAIAKSSLKPAIRGWMLAISMPTTTGAAPSWCFPAIRPSSRSA